MLNSHTDARLTKGGGIPLDVWLYILNLEIKSHGNPVPPASRDGWQDYYDEDETPHAALEADFQYAEA